MFLSRIALNGWSRVNMALTDNTHAIHRAVRSMWPTDERHPLWRLDTTPTTRTLWVISATEPQRNVFDGELTTVALKINPAKGTPLTFKIKLNAVASAKPTMNDAGNLERGKLIPVIQEQRDWVTRQLAKAGLTEADFVIEQSVREIVTKHTGEEVPLTWVYVSGLAKVDDPDALRAAIFNGVGRGRQYGCGLLTVAAAVPRS